MSSKRKEHPETTVEESKEKIQRAVREGEMSVINSILNSASSHQKKTFLVPSQNNTERNTLIHLSCIGGHSRVLKTLIQFYGNDIAHRTNKLKQTPLHLAAMNGYLRIVKTLVEEYHTDPMVSDNEGNTALHFSAQHGLKDLAKYFLEKGIPVDTQNKKNQTALHISIEKGNIEFSKELIKNGATSEIEDCDKRTAKTIAVEKGMSHHFGWNDFGNLEKRAEETKVTNLLQVKRGRKPREKKDKAKEEKEKSIFEELHEAMKRKGKEKEDEDFDEIHRSDNEDSVNRFVMDKRQILHPFMDNPFGITGGGMSHRISQDLESEAIDWDDDPSFFSSGVESVSVRYER